MREAVQLGAAAAAEESAGAAIARGTNRAIETQKGAAVFMVASMIASVGEEMTVSEEIDASKTANAKLGEVLIFKQEKAVATRNGPAHLSLRLNRKG